MAGMGEVETCGLGGKTLAELAGIANTEHAALGANLSSALTHAIRCGEAIHEAHVRVGGAAWAGWVRENLAMSGSNASRFERLAVYRDLLPPEAMAPWQDASGRTFYPSPSRAMVYLRSLPRLHKNIRDNRTPDVVREEVVRLSAEGLSQARVAELTGVSRSTVKHIVDPAYEKRQRARDAARLKRRAAAERALAEQERLNQRASAARAAGGALAESYSLVRKLAQKADEARLQADPEARTALDRALAKIHQAEDLIGDALKVPSARLASLRKVA